MSTQRYTELEMVQAWNNYCEDTGRLDDRIYKKGLNEETYLNLLYRSETLDGFMVLYGGSK